MEANSYDVFISYSSHDQKTVEGICGYLESLGVRCFVAYRDIPRGVVWAAAIVKALKVSSLMVVVFSDEFNNSNQVDREIELASERSLPILTFRLSNTDFKDAKEYYLKNLNWIDAFPDPETAFGDLADNVFKLLGRQPAPVGGAVAAPKSEPADDNFGAQIHIRPDMDCKLLKFDTVLAELKGGRFNHVRLKKGKYVLEFVSAADPSVRVEKYRERRDQYVFVLALVCGSLEELQRKLGLSKNESIV